MLYVKESTRSIDDVCARLQQATAQNKFGILGIIDLKEKMASKGVEFGPQCRIIEVCNPMQAKKVLEKDMTISSALPCRISVYEEDGKVKIITLLPTVLIKMFGKPELDAVAKDIENTLIRIIDIAC
jgi:uncharacterized protein (DUF302 family)